MKIKDIFIQISRNSIQKEATKPMAVCPFTKSPCQKSNCESWTEAKKRRSGCAFRVIAENIDRTLTV